MELERKYPKEWNTQRWEVRFDRELYKEQDWCDYYQGKCIYGKSCERCPLMTVVSKIPKEGNYEQN